MKTYVLLVSRYFPKGHPKEGKPTEFKDKILLGLKIHTIRENCELWIKRIEEVQQGKAVISLREWTGKPYQSKQAEIKQLNALSGLGYQLVTMEILCKGWFTEKPHVNDVLKKLAQKDGLTVEDFKSWFRNVKFGTTYIIIHFTKFRYD